MANQLLKGKKGIIFGALNDQSIAWKVAERAHEEGAPPRWVFRRKGTRQSLAHLPGALQDLRWRQKAVWEVGRNVLVATARARQREVRAGREGLLCQGPRIATENDTIDCVNDLC